MRYIFRYFIACWVWVDMVNYVLNTTKQFFSPKVNKQSRKIPKPEIDFENNQYSHLRLMNVSKLAWKWLYWIGLRLNTKCCQNWTFVYSYFLSANQHPRHSFTVILKIKVKIFQQMKVNYKIIFLNIETKCIYVTVYGA